MQIILQLFYVFIGGGLGAVCRYGVSQSFTSKNFPLATWAINVIGSLLIGYILGKCSTAQATQAQLIKLTLATGFCGGFTTFSTFSYEVLQLLQQQKIGIALVYILASVVVSIIAVYIGFIISK